MKPLTFLLGVSLALSGLNVRGETTPYVAMVQDRGLQATAERVKSAFHMIEIPSAGAQCSGVARSATVLMLAEHCFRSTTPDALIIDDSYEAVVDHIARDGHDHVLVSLKAVHFPGWVNMAKARPKQGDWVFIYGAPMGFRDLLRFGTYAGQEQQAIVYDLNTDHGDSGGAIFNAQGEVVDIVYGSPGEMDWLTLCWPIQFTRSEEAWVGL